MAQLPPIYRIAFQGLWCFADREGKLKDRPLQLKIEILPYDNVDFDEILNVLAKKKPINNTTPFIIRYEAEGGKYIKIVNFHKHQFPHIKEQKSIIPEPYDTKTPCKHDAKTIAARLLMVNGERLTVNGDKYFRDFFEKEFWPLYPERNGKKLLKKEALEFFIKNIKDKELEHILKAVQNYANSTECRNGYAKDAIRWLRNDRWREWVEPEKEGRWNF